MNNPAKKKIYATNLSSNRFEPRVLKDQRLAPHRVELDHGARVLAHIGHLSDAPDAECGVPHELPFAELCGAVLGIGVGDAAIVAARRAADFQARAVDDFK